tara:strand:+ start:703 stop:849 length:147 start_codon:yes stop_codon:yes gene_type:complete
MPVLFIGALPIFLGGEKQSGISIMGVIFALLFLVRLFADYWFFVRKSE